MSAGQTRRTEKPAGETADRCGEPQQEQSERPVIRSTSASKLAALKADRKAVRKDRAE